MDQRTALLDEAVRTEIADSGQVRPPYLAFPGVGPFDIGWRMGSGEWHIMVWSHWWAASRPDEASRLAYFHQHPPPAAWLQWSATAVWPELDEEVDDPDDDFGGAAVRRLAEHGIGSYEGWREWLTQADD